MSRLWPSTTTWPSFERTMCPGGTASRCVASAWCCNDAVLLHRMLISVGSAHLSWWDRIAVRGEQALRCSAVLDAARRTCRTPPNLTHLPHPSQPHRTCRTPISLHLPHPSQPHLAGALPSRPRCQLGRRAVCKHSEPALALHARAQECVALLCFLLRASHCSFAAAASLLLLMLLMLMLPRCRPAAAAALLDLPLNTRHVAGPAPLGRRPSLRPRWQWQPSFTVPSSPNSACWLQAQSCIPPAAAGRQL